jgi:hypothetical protein
MIWNEAQVLPTIAMGKIITAGLMGYDNNNDIIGQTFTYRSLQPAVLVVVSYFWMT